MTTAFVLSAGGMLGDFEIGALRFLYNRGIRPEIVCGSSVGAINGAAIAEGEGGLEKLERIWLGLNSNSDIYVDQPWLATTQEKLRELTRTDLAAEVAKMLFMPPLFMVDTLNFGVNLTELGLGLSRASGSKSTFDPAPLADKIRRNLDVGAVARSGIKLRIGVCSLESGRFRFVNELGQFTDGPYETVNLADAVMASAAIPAVFPPVKLGTDNYVDAGVRTLLPIGAAVAERATEVYAIIAPTSGTAKVPSFDQTNLLRIGERCLAIQYDQILNNDMFPPLGWGLPVHYVQPTLDVHLGLDIERGHIWITIGYGFMRAGDRVFSAGDEARFNVFADLSNRITRLRMDIWDDEHLANGELRPVHLDPNTGKVVLAERPSTSGLSRVPDPDYLRSVRQKKRNLHDLILQRKRSLGSPAPQLNAMPRSVDFEQTPLCGSHRRMVLAQNLGGGAVPPDADQWFLGWEHHMWIPMMPTPWDAFYSRAGNVPAEAPPDSTGSADLRITSISTTHPAFQARPSGTAPSMTLREGDTLAIEVTFAPTSEGLAQGSLVITTTMGTTVRVGLMGTGVRIPQRISLDPPIELIFGMVSVGQRKSRSLLVFNNGSENLTINGLEIVNQDPDPAFAIVGSPNTITIPCFQRRIIEIVFTPSDAVPYSATLVTTSDDPNRQSLSVSLSGIGSEPPEPPEPRRGDSD